MLMQFITCFQAFKRISLIILVVYTSCLLAACSNRETKAGPYELRRIVKKATEVGDFTSRSAILPLIEEIDRHKAKEEFDKSNIETPLEPLEERLLIMPDSADIPQSIMDVFEKDSTFMDAYFSIETRLSDYNICTLYENIEDWERYEHANVYWISYATVDFDGDGENELVYLVDEGCRGGGHYVIFHDIEGVVYSYRVPYRAMGFLKKDGTAESNSGASDNRWYRITKFRKDGIETDILGMMSSWGYENGEEVYKNSYYVGTEEVTEDFFYNKFLAEMDEKEPVNWVNN